MLDSSTLSGSNISWEATKHPEYHADVTNDNLPVHHYQTSPLTTKEWL